MRSLDIQLCNDSWYPLQNICNHLGDNLKEMVWAILHLEEEEVLERYADFATAKMTQGITTCVASHSEDLFTFEYFWAAATSSSDLVKLLTRTVPHSAPTQHPDIRIWGDRFSARSLPSNIMEVLSSLTEEGLFDLSTNLKFKSIPNLDHLNSCVWIVLYNEAEIEEEEVDVCEAILDHVAKEPRPRNLMGIRLPKVNNTMSFKKTTSEM